MKSPEQEAYEQGYHDALIDRHKPSRVITGFFYFILIGGSLVALIKFLAWMGWI